MIYPIHMALSVVDLVQMHTVWLERLCSKALHSCASHCGFIFKREGYIKHAFKIPSMV